MGKFKKVKAGWKSAQDRKIHRNLLKAKTPLAVLRAIGQKENLTIQVKEQGFIAFFSMNGKIYESSVSSKYDACHQVAVSALKDAIAIRILKLSQMRNEIENNFNE